MKFIAALVVSALALSAGAAEPASIYDIVLKDIDGKAASLKPFKGKVLLIVNVASKCGYTGQYAGLQDMQKKFAARGFSVLGFPCNDFGGQEPGTSAEIKQFCTSQYQVTFPMFDKVSLKAPDTHPLFANLTGKGSPFPGEVTWNFSKFLVSRDGKLLKRFDSGVEPDDAELMKAIEAALAAK